MAGTAVGLSAAASVGLLALAANLDEDIADVRSATVTAVLLATPVALGILVGLATAHALPWLRGGVAFTLMAAFAIVFTGPLLPMVPLPILLAAGGLALERRRSSRVVCAAVIGLGAGMLVALPAGALLYVGGGPSVLGLAVGVAVGIAAAVQAHRRIRPKGPAAN